VWYLEALQDWDRYKSDIHIRQFTSRDVDEFIKAKLAVEPVEEANTSHAIELIRREFTAAWTNFIGYDDDKPVSTSKLFVKDDIGYLAWGFTSKEFRRMGHHQAHVLARVRHSFESGCKLVFTVTDFNVPSSLSLQKVGFKLAYNYLLMEKRATAE
jgi:hypothetical protein